MAGDGVEASDEFEHFYAAYERAVESEIKGEMQERDAGVMQYHPR